MRKLEIPKLTATQYETLKAINDFIQATGHAPTHNELAEALHLPKPRAVANRIDALVNKGYLDQTRSQSRGMRLSKKAMAEHPELAKIAS